MRLAPAGSSHMSSVPFVSSVCLRGVWLSLDSALWLSLDLRALHPPSSGSPAANR
jgi:hypothetical protein